MFCLRLFLQESYVSMCRKMLDIGSDAPSRLFLHQSYMSMSRKILDIVSDAPEPTVPASKLYVHQQEDVGHSLRCSRADCSCIKVMCPWAGRCWIYSQMLPSQQRVRNQCRSGVEFWQFKFLALYDETDINRSKICYFKLLKLTFSTNKVKLS